MMEEDEVVLSDVHIYTENIKKQHSNLEHNVAQESRQEGGPVVSRFVFEIPDFCSPNDETGSLVDEDGDLIVARRPETKKEVITLEHTLATTLKLVGLQVWSGCMLLTDYILHNRVMFQGKTVLELGGGVGLCSIVAAMYADVMIYTDVNPDVLSLCQANFSNNNHLWELRKQKPTVFIKELNWNKSLVNCTQDDGNISLWNPEERAHLKNVSIILAADVIYEDDLTDAFFRTVMQLLSEPPNKKLILSLEKRFNFTLSDLDIACSAYDHFMAWLNHISSQTNIYSVQSIAINFPQRFCYERSPHIAIIMNIPGYTAEINPVIQFLPHKLQNLGPERLHPVL